MDCLGCPLTKNNMNKNSTKSTTNKYVTLNKSFFAFVSDTPNKTIPFCKRISQAVQLKKLSASITVETALVLPIFIFVFISLIYFSTVIQYTNCVQEGLHEAAKEMAEKSYVLSSGNSNLTSSKLSGVALSETYVRSYVNKYLSSVYMSPGSISYIRSNFSGDIIDIVAEEKIEIPYSFFNTNSLYLLERARVHAWTGYSGNENITANSSNEEIVFITDSGSVYHKNRGCYHLKVTPRPVSAEAIENERSSGGAKYYPCEYCSKNTPSSVYYVTDYGNRYHTSVNCGAITRNIQAIKLSEVGNRRPCKTCS